MRSLKLSLIPIALALSGLAATAQDASRLRELDREIGREPNSIAARLARAEIRLEMKQPTEAMADCDYILKLRPDDGLGLYCRARVSIALQRLDDALRDLDAGAQKLPRQAHILITRASIHYQQGDYDAAIADLNRALALDERNATALAARGEAYLAKGLTDRAMEDFRLVLAIDRNDLRAKRGLAFAQARVERSRVAAADAPQRTRGLPIEPASPPTAAEPAQQSPPAGGGSQALIEVDPKLLAQVKQDLAKRQFKPAIDLIDAALGQAASHAGLYNLRGTIWQESGNLEKAASDFDRAVALLPQYPDAHVNRIAARLAWRKTDEATVACQEFLGLYPDLGLPYDMCGRVLIQENKLGEAKAALDNAISKDPRLVIAWVHRGQVGLRAKDYDGALNDFSHAIELDGKADAAYAGRGRVFLAKADEKRAIIELRKSLSINRTNWTAATALQALQVVKVLAQLGQIKKN
jgi:tetratricopeptide (TPR) repeat protein